MRTNSYRIKAEELNKIETDCIQNYPLEACGFLLGNRKKGVILKVVAAVNIEKSSIDFNIHPQDILKITQICEKNNLDLLGFYHSHIDIDCELSPKDLNFMKLWSNIVWLIISVIESKVIERKAFMLMNDKVVEIGLIT